MLHQNEVWTIHELSIYSCKFDIWLLLQCDSTHLFFHLGPFIDWVMSCRVVIPILNRLKHVAYGVQCTKWRRITQLTAFAKYIQMNCDDTDFRKAVKIVEYQGIRSRHRTNPNAASNIKELIRPLCIYHYYTDPYGRIYIQTWLPLWLRSTWQV